MLHQIQKSFPKMSACCQPDITNYVFGVIDDHDDEPCRIQWASGDIRHFTVKNPQRDNITFWAIDKCLYSSNDPVRRCDFIIFNQNNFCFVEIKNTENRRCNRMTKAIEQLEVTINEFKSTLNFENYILEAYIAFKNKKPIPTSTNFQSAKIKFFEKYNVNLFDSNEKIFIP